MTPDAHAEMMLVQSRADVAPLRFTQGLVYGYAAAMRSLPAYVSFSKRHPDFGNAVLAHSIAAGLRDWVLVGVPPPGLDAQVQQLDDRYVPDMDDFGSDSAALEGALALIFLHRYGQTQDPTRIVEILRGITECILMADDKSGCGPALTTEDQIRRGQLDIIGSAPEVSEQLLARCLALNAAPLQED